MRCLLEDGMTAHLFLGAHDKQDDGPHNGSPEGAVDCRCVVSHYQAVPKVICDLANEAKNEPGKAYIAGRIAVIRSPYACRGVPAPPTEGEPSVAHQTRPAPHPMARSLSRTESVPEGRPLETRPSVYTDSAGSRNLHEYRWIADRPSVLQCSFRS